MMGGGKRRESWPGEGWRREAGGMADRKEVGWWKGRWGRKAGGKAGREERVGGAGGKVGGVRRVGGREEAS